MPKLLEMYKSFNAQSGLKEFKKVDVYGVTTNPDLNEWKKYIHDNKLPWYNVEDSKHESNFRRLYDVYSTPVIYLLDENKKIVAKRLDVEHMKDFIEKGIK